jgi:hypothetical protein
MPKKKPRTGARRAVTSRTERKPEPAPPPQRAAIHAYRIPPADPRPSLGYAVARLLGALRPIVAAVNPSRLDWLDKLPASLPAEAVADAVWAGGWVASLAPAGFPAGRFRADLLRWLELLSSCLDQAAAYRAQHPQASWVDALDESEVGDEAKQACERLCAGFHGLQTELLDLEARAGVSGRDVTWVELEPQTLANAVKGPGECDEPRLTTRQWKVARAMLRHREVQGREDWAKDADESAWQVRETIRELCRVGYAEQCGRDGAWLTPNGRKCLRAMVDRAQQSCPPQSAIDRR